MAENNMSDKGTNTAAPKRLRYVGPGSEKNPNGRVPIVTNLPIDLGQPRLGLRPPLPANELTEEYALFVMNTNTTAARWWAYE